MAGKSVWSSDPVMRLVTLVVALSLTAQEGRAVDPGVLAAFRAETAGKIMTVQGPIDAGDAGVTLAHEHLFIDFRLPLDEPQRWTLAERVFPETPEQKRLWRTRIGLDNLAHVIDNIWSVEEALLIDDFAAVRAEISRFKRAGGATVVDVTNIGLGRDPRRLQRLSRESGLNIVMGAGWYRDAWRPASFSARSVESLTEELVRDIVVGVDGSGVKAGIIGEIPAMTIVTDPADSDDVKQLRAAARASRLTGAAITLHQWLRGGESLMKTLDILEAEGADLSRVIVGHVGGDAAAHMPLLEEAIKRGVTLEFDLFGVPFYLDAPHLDNRVMADTVVAFLAKGFAANILLSHDVCTKIQHESHGGKGFDYVLTDVTPYLRARGATEDDLHAILVANPALLLRLKPSEN